MVKVKAEDNLVRALAKDIEEGIVKLGDGAAMHLVDTYLHVLRFRQAQLLRVADAEKKGLPASFRKALASEFDRLYNGMKSVLESYATTHPAGQWAMGIKGIGPVGAGMLLAYVDPKRFANPSKVWRYAGLDPTVRWEPGQKRPWNPNAKLMAYILGNSVSMQPNKSDYGHLFTARKRYEWARNAEGYNAEAAKRMLKGLGGRGTADTKSWLRGMVSPSWVKEKLQRGELSFSNPEPLRDGEEGVPMLPPGIIHARARRWTAKLIIAHFWEVRYWYEHGELPPKPWVMQFGGHTDRIEPPNAPWL